MMMTEKEAKKAGAALAKKLGPDWKTEVWKNGGWHYKVSLVGIQVYPSFFDGKVENYTAFLNEPGEIGGVWHQYAKTPEKAIAAVLKQAEDDLARKERIVFNARAALGQTPEIAIGRLDKLTDALFDYDEEWGFKERGSTKTQAVLQANKKACAYLRAKE